MKYNRRQLELEDRLRSLRIRDEDVLKKMEIVLENQKKQMEIERKMDLILEKLENQSRIEERIEELLKRQTHLEALTVEIRQNDTERTNENREILDVVETNLGWMDYFSEENERFEKQIAQIQENCRKTCIEIGQLAKKAAVEDENLNFLKARMDQISQIPVEEKHMELVARLENGDLAEKTETILRDIKYVRSMIPDPMFECICGCVSQKERLLREDGVSIECPKCERLQIVWKLYDERRKWMRHEKCGHYQQYPLDTREGDVRKCQICGQKGELRQLVLKCCRSFCKLVLPKNLPLREDGVSVECPQCYYINIIGTLKEGQKWMYICCCWQFQQVPLDKKEYTKAKCPDCGKEGLLRAARYWVSSYS